MTKKEVEKMNLTELKSLAGKLLKWATWIIELQKENHKEKKELHIMDNIPPLKDVDDKDEEKKVN